MYRRAEFFPDGKRILFDADRVLGNPEGYVQDLEGGPPKRIEGMLPFIVSPDGKSLVATGPDGLYLLPSGGESPPRPIPGGHLDWPLQWGADGRAIYTYMHDESQLILSRLDLATGRSERRWAVSPPDKAGFLHFGTRPVGMGTNITPDGRYYAYTYFTDQSRLILTDVGPNWWR
jgi:hypothetical protein